jgi:hypothetical protein
MSHLHTGGVAATIPARRAKPPPSVVAVQHGGARSPPPPQFSLVKKNAEAAAAIHFTLDEHTSQARLRRAGPRPPLPRLASGVARSARLTDPSRACRSGGGRAPLPPSLEPARLAGSDSSGGGEVDEGRGGEAGRQWI